MKFKITIITFFLLYALRSYEQQVSDTSASRVKVMPDKFDTLLTTLQLDTLNGKIKTIYSKGYELRAKTIQSLVEKCSGFYEEKFPEIKFTVQLMILDKKDWSKLEVTVPYGMPSSFIPKDKLLIAADKKAAGELFGQTDTLPDEILSDFDDIALHELGHNFFIKLTNTDTKRRWANEFLASYFAMCYLEESKSKKGLLQLDQHNSQPQSNFQPQYKTLEDFEQLYVQVGPQNFGWYHGKFQKLGIMLYPKFKIDLIRKFIDNYSAKGKNLDPLILLKQMAPEITNQWLEEMK